MRIHSDPIARDYERFVLMKLSSQGVCVYSSPASADDPPRDLRRADIPVRRWQIISFPKPTLPGNILLMPAPKKTAARSVSPDKSKSLESWIRDAACSIRGAKDAPNRVERDSLQKAARRAHAGACSATISTISYLTSSTAARV